MPTRLAPRPSRSRRSGNLAGMGAVSTTSSLPDVTHRGGTPLPADVVASTFANADLRVSRAAVAEYSERCDALSRANAELRAALERQERDSIQVVERLEGDLRAARAEAAGQRAEVQRLLAEASTSAAALREEYERAIAERDEQLAALGAVARRLQTAASASGHGRAAAAAAERERLRAALDEAVAAHDAELAALRFQTVDRKVRLIALESAMREEFRQHVEEAAGKLLEQRSAALIQDHAALMEERERLTYDIEELVRLTTAQHEEGAGVRRRGELQEHACTEALRRIVHGNQRAREAAVKTQQLESRVKELLHENRTIRNDLARQYEKQIETLEKTLAETRASLQTHRTELQRMRQIASTVVAQRSDLERFFYVALKDVRRMRAGTSHHARSTPVPGRPLPQHRQPQQQHKQITSTSSLSPSPPAVPQKPSSIHNVEMRNVNSSGFRPQQQQQHQQQEKEEQQQSSKSHTVASTGQGLGGAATFLTESRTSLLTSSTVPTPVTGPAVVVAPTAQSLEPHRRRVGSGLKLSKEVAINAGTTTGGCFNKTINNNSNNVLNVDLGESGDGAYLDDLSWEDKEKIIKALLFFINQTCYQRLPGNQVVASDVE
ncbi:uncharacterized protein TM35_000302000 [Trypanosoma theileri]|uniref:Uncharacterized protein n=1 Tax=Trypanosoma theileri TaxID=67003 RepID=A0A1X0NPU9_9TRYP|nr:uncharacterized protein TM35_000302000 [Trypanosoma theileri]ORC86160.1 hypothetical protein TM35_000302000 [Trypanosoma theileri]